MKRPVYGKCKYFTEILRDHRGHQDYHRHCNSFYFRVKLSDIPVLSVSVSASIELQIPVSVPNKYIRSQYSINF